VTEVVLDPSVVVRTAGTPGPEPEDSFYRTSMDPRAYDPLLVAAGLRETIRSGPPPVKIAYVPKALVEEWKRAGVLPERMLEIHWATWPGDLVEEERKGDS
jgi:hypothetical protein